MSDAKSKFPDLRELSSMAGKLFKDVKTSVCEIIDDYKEKRAEPADSEPEKAPASPEKPAAKAEKATPKKAEAKAEEAASEPVKTESPATDQASEEKSKKEE